MFVVMDATGRVGSAVAAGLLAAGEWVTVLTRHPEQAAHWAAKGAAIALADAEDAGSLHAAFRQGRRAFLLNPPADPHGDTDVTERRTIANILSALEASGLEKVVAASTYGAQLGDAIGDLSTLWELEAGLRAQPVPAAINRGAYYMSNWLAYADMVRDTGLLPSMFPADTVIPMVAPADLGHAAVARLLAPVEDTALRHVEGPQRYTPRDVANAFAATLGREVTVQVTPRSEWKAAFEDAGFSPSAAQAYARMTAVSLDSGFAAPTAPGRGAVTLEQFIATAIADRR